MSDASHRYQTSEKRAAQQSGTARAIKENGSSGTSLRRNGWGGKRNSSDRTSDCISASQAENLLAAVDFAKRIGLPLNRHITIHWEQAGLPDTRACDATGRFLKLASDWIVRKGGRTAYVWVRENGARKGSHVHILLHLPAGVSLGSLQARWLRSITKQTYVERTVLTRRIGRVANAAAATPEVYEANLAEVCGYVLKGASDGAADTLQLSRRQPGGTVLGKRASTSQNIGKAARAAAIK